MPSNKLHGELPTFGISKVQMFLTIHKKPLMDSCDRWQVAASEAVGSNQTVRNQGDAGLKKKSFHIYKLYLIK